VIPENSIDNIFQCNEAIDTPLNMTDFMTFAVDLRTKARYWIKIILLISLANKILLPKKLILHNLDVVMELNYLCQQYVGTLFYPGHIGCLVVAISDYM
jgi:hypothetical protein